MNDMSAKAHTPVAAPIARWSRLAQTLLGTTLGRSMVLVAAVVAGDMLLPGIAPSPIRRLMALLAGICPQRPAHSYTIAGVQLPIEARMLGMFAGVTTVVLVFATSARAQRFRFPAPRALALVVLGFTAMAFDGTNALFYDLGLPHAYAPDLRVRLITGLLAGIAMGVFLVPTLAAAVTPAPPRSARPTWGDLSVIALGSGGFGLLVASGWASLLLPLAFVGAFGVVLAFTLINRTILSAAVWPAQGEAHVLWWPEICGVILALLELALLAWLRHLIGQ